MSPIYYGIRNALVNQNDDEIRFTEECNNNYHNNPLMNAWHDYKTSEDVDYILNLKVSRLILEAFSFCGTRWRIYGSTRLSPMKCLAGYISDPIEDLFENLKSYLRFRRNISVETVSKKTAELHNVERYKTVSIRNKKKEILMVFETEECEVPKKISSSPTDGIRIKNVSFIGDCTIGELLEGEDVFQMKKTVLTRFYMHEFSQYADWSTSKEESMDMLIDDADALIAAAQSYKELLLKLNGECKADGDC